MEGKKKFVFDTAEETEKKISTTDPDSGFFVKANSREVLQDGSAASVWCSAAQRRFIVMERDNSKVFMILASDKR